MSDLMAPLLVAAVGLSACLLYFLMSFTCCWISPCAVAAVNGEMIRPHAQNHPYCTAVLLQVRKISECKDTVAIPMIRDCDSYNYRQAICVDRVRWNSINNKPLCTYFYTSINPDDLHSTEMHLSVQDP